LRFCHYCNMPTWVAEHLKAGDGMEEMISHDGCQVLAMTQDPSKSGE
jgi:hypothetical protein